MGSQAEYFSDIYAKTHEERLKESIDLARKELVDRYGANATYLKYLDGEMALYEQELTKIQGAIADYTKARGGKLTPSADDTAKLLGVMTDAGNTIGREAGEAAQRKLEAEATIEGRYRLSGEQTNAVGRAGDYLGKIDLTTARSPADLQRAIDAAVDQVGAGTFASGTDAAKTGTAELYSRIDRALANNAIYQGNPALKTYIANKVSQKLGTNTSYISRSAVDADKTTAIDAAKTEVGVTGTGTSARAAQLAEQALSGKLGTLSDAEKKEVMEWMKSPAGNAYISAIDSGATQDEAIVRAAANLDGTAGKTIDEVKLMLFQLPTSKDDIRAKVRTEGVSFDTAKYFDPAWTGLNARSKSTEGKLTDIRRDRSESISKLKDVPTEEQARRRGVEIYEPIMPGVGARAREAQVRTEEGAQEGLLARSRPGARPGETIDDYLASRMARETSPIPDSQRVLAGASAAAIRNGPMAEKTGDWDAASDPGFRMYNNVREKQLKDTSPDALVRYAADLAGGDPIKRDDILREYYQWALKEKMEAEPARRKEAVEKAEKPPGPVDIANVKSEDLNF